MTSIIPINMCVCVALQKSVRYYPNLLLFANTLGVKYEFNN